METTLKTAPLKEPVSMDDAKAHMRIDDDIIVDDQLIYSAITEARVMVEEYLWRKLITQTWYAYLDDWPGGNHIELPFGKLQSVTAIKYTDTDADETEWSNTEYLVGTDYLRGRVSLAYGYTWPSVVLSASNPIQVEFVCGYGLTAAAVPATIRRGIMIMISEIYENREKTVYGQTIAQNDLMVNLLSPYRINKL